MKLPTMDQCTFTLTVEQDDIPVRGNALSSGFADMDKECEDHILARLDDGDVWAWALVHVSCTYGPVTGDDYLGACSYKDEEDFKTPGGHCDDMKHQSYADMCSKLTAANLSLL